MARKQVKSQQSPFDQPNGVIPDGLQGRSGNQKAAPEALGPGLRLRRNRDDNAELGAVGSRLIPPAR